MRWIREQPWCDGRVVMTGGSYLGTTQWAVGPFLEDPLSAMTVSVGSSTMMGSWYPQGALGLDQTLRWAFLIAKQEGRLGGLSLLLNKRRIARALAAPDFRNADVAAIGSASPVFRAGVEHADDQGYWIDALDHRAARSDLVSPTSMVTGWHDLFLRDQLEDHRALVAAGRESRITIGPWSHASSELIPIQVRDALEFFEHTLHDKPLPRVAPVRLFVQGAEQWRDFAAWPPPSETVQLTLSDDGAARFGAARFGALDTTGTATIRFSPADPTPSVGGPTLNAPAGRQDQRAVECRSDVLLHTTTALSFPIEVIGVITARLTVSTPDPTVLVVVRVCDVDEAGTSRNVTEGLVRIQSTSSGLQTVDLELDPTAYVFGAGHRIRIHLAAGSHPRVVDQRGGSYRVEVSYAAGHAPQITLPRSAPAS